MSQNMFCLEQQALVYTKALSNYRMIILKLNFITKVWWIDTRLVKWEVLKYIKKEIHIPGQTIWVKIFIQNCFVMRDQ